MKSIINTVLATPLYKHLLFWVAVFSFYTTSARERFSSVEEIVVTYGMHLFFQIIVAYTVLYFIVPRYKKYRKWWLAGIELVGLFLIVNFMYVWMRMNVLEPRYPTCYLSFIESFGHLTLWQRTFDVKAVFWELPLFYIQPLFFLTALQFYEKQYEHSKVKEHKKVEELRQLRQQLNPHFLFNTLNNLYALSVEKSDKTPQVIERLSDILSYMLYGTESKFVPIQKEIDLIENYLALEQIRYEGRVLISFEQEVITDFKIAPLLLLTFVENAFKHGVSQELKMATVKVSLFCKADKFFFVVENTKPISIAGVSMKKGLGLANVKQQLELLYPGEHDIRIVDEEDKYFIQLMLKKK